jgi:hypothetical protein
MVDDRKSRLRRNLYRHWAFAAASAYAATSSSSVGYSPASLFEGGTYQGFWLDASNLSTLKQNSGGSGAVTADGDPVGYIADAAGTAGVWDRRLDDTCRPLYKIVGGNSCIRFDGTNDGFSVNATARTWISSSSSQTAVAVITSDNTGPATQIIYWQYATSFNWAIQFRTSTTEFRQAYNNNLFIGRGVTANQTRCLTSVIAPSTQILRRDGVQLGATDTTTVSAFSGPGSGEGYGGWVDFGGPTDFLKGDLYQLFVINRELTGTDLTNLETFLAAKAGITI